MEKASWTISAADAQGKVLGEAVHTATLPPEPRSSSYEAALSAALSSRLAELRAWLGKEAAGKVEAAAQQAQASQQ